MADRTVGGESGVNVIRIRRLFEVSQMAGCAIGRSTRELSVHVALGTLHGSVGAAQRKSGSSSVIELGSQPSHCRVTLLTRCWKT